MSRRHNRSANSVSLFPFLAVLVCAMGALILLLIVTTRRVRSEALTRAAEKSAKTHRQRAESQGPRAKSPEPSSLSSQPLALRPPLSAVRPRKVAPVPPDEPNIKLRRRIADLQWMNPKFAPGSGGSSKPSWRLLLGCPSSGLSA